MNFSFSFFFFTLIERENSPFSPKSFPLSGEKVQTQGRQIFFKVITIVTPVSQGKANKKFQLVSGVSLQAGAPYNRKIIMEILLKFPAL